MTTKTLPFPDPAAKYDIDDLMDKEPPARQRSLVYPLTWDDELDQVEKVSWLVDGILPANGLSVIYGNPGVGKTFISLDWSMAIAQGMHWHGRLVQPGEVVYVVAEGWRGIKDRVAAWKAANGALTTERTGVAFVGRPLRMLDDHDAEMFVNIVRDGGIEPALVVIDTLARNAVGVDENNAKDMGRVVSYADYVREELNTAVLLVHHARKNAEGRAVLRGSSALSGAADMIALVEQEEDDTAHLVMKNDKMKDGPAFPKMNLTLVPYANSVAVEPGRKFVPKQETLNLEDFPEET